MAHGSTRCWGPAACVLASPGFWMRDRAEMGIDFLKLVHGEQSVVVHAPLPASGALVGRSQVTRIVDKGEGKGDDALVVVLQTTSWPRLRRSLPHVVAAVEVATKGGYVEVDVP